MRKHNSKVVLITTGLLLMVLCTSCSDKKIDKSNNQENTITTDATPDDAYYFSKLTQVREHFGELYSSQALGNPTMKMKEKEIDAQCSMGASIKRFLTEDKEPLRYIITYYGETGQQQIDYYVDDFGLFVSEINMVYASQNLNSDYMDPLYTEVSNYCIKDGQVYEMLKDKVIKSDKVFDYTSVDQLDALYDSGEN